MRRWMLPIVSMSISAGVGASTANGGDAAAGRADVPSASGRFHPKYAEPPARGRDAANVPSHSGARADEPRLDEAAFVE